MGSQCEINYSTYSRHRLVSQLPLNNYFFPDFVAAECAQPVIPAFLYLGIGEANNGLVATFTLAAGGGFRHGVVFFSALRGIGPR